MAKTAAIIITGIAIALLVIYGADVASKADVSGSKCRFFGLKLLGTSLSDMAFKIAFLK